MSRINAFAALSRSRPLSALAHAPRSLVWRVLALGLAGLLCLPIASLVMIALKGSAGLWSHILTGVLPGVAVDTLLLLAGVGLFASVVGTGTAWLVTAYRFPGRRLFEWALLLPALL